ncbi:pimeloyl-ACP methyl ester carboxylesterase [Amycolatopsis echigonensis]|uniref:Pimeloyl-ACP methyl ester carboxylesterase n=1 Tax=Amycolatopsis echigonensis TaxID=2576905 RepID=A0A2N3WU07_9PSEU|nr:epoxide hydrolase family protein [Amycolatopsis niigatensis]PKV97344.1 pimeloyl-ACP methyl ester carboxylesterase [Amycolatopsis niigatensis]
MAAEPFKVSVSEAEIADLRDRLRRTRWPEPEPVPDWSQGVPLAYAQELCRSWAEDYDFGFADRVNAFPQYRDTIDGLGIHFLHIRSPEPDAFPLVLTHGWPGSVLEFLQILGPLTDPRAHGGDPADAFHIVAPSLPGYGWSDKPTTTGWGVTRTARAWDTLMTSLGYQRYGAQGGDWGSAVSGALGEVAPERVAGVHLNLGSVAAGAFDDPTPAELANLEAEKEMQRTGRGYSAIQATRPQTLGYGLTDSPAGQAAWIAEKFWAWTDNHGHPEDAVPRQAILDEISVYWFTASATSSARLYWESFAHFRDKVTAPSGLAVYPRDITRPSRREAELRFTDLRWYQQLPRGGHFAALEQPESLVEQVRGFFRLVR